MLKILLLLSGIQFVDIADRSGLRFQHESGSQEKLSQLETMSGGVAWIDYDSDGRLDLYFVNGGRSEDLTSGVRSVSNALFRNTGGSRFEDVTARAGVPGPRWGMGVTAVDYDDDGDTDLYVCNFGPNTLYRNNGDGTFTDITERAGIGGDEWSSFGAFADYNGDGHLDIYVVNYVAYDRRIHTGRNCVYRGMDVHCGPNGLPAQADRLYRNNGDGTFTDTTRLAGINAAPSYGLGVIWADYDSDGDPDIYVANDSKANYLYQNNGDGTFLEVGLLAGLAFNEDGNAQAGMGIAFGDYDGDGFPDFFVTHFSDDNNTLYKNLGHGVFRDQTYSAGLAFNSRQHLGWGTHFFDYDNDARPDLFVANGHVYPQVEGVQIGTRYLQGKLVYRNLGDGRFESAEKALGPDLSKPSSSRGAAFADFDKDGDIDIVVNNLDGSPQLFRNDGGSASGHWISLLLRGARSNRNAIGTRVSLLSGSTRQTQEVQGGSSYQSTNDYRLHFGLGSETRSGRIEIRWPTGTLQTLEGLAADKHYVLVKGGEVLVEDGG